MTQKSSQIWEIGLHVYKDPQQSEQIPTVLYVMPDPEDKTSAHILHTGREKQKQNIILEFDQNFTLARALKPLNTKK